MRTRIVIRQPLVTLCTALLVALILSACGDDVVALAPTPTLSPSPTATSTPTPTPTPTVTPAAARSVAYLHVESTPEGATVRTGIQYVNNVDDVTTGRVVGTSPLTVELQASDVTIVQASGEANLLTLLQFPGYFDDIVLLDLGQGGTLEPGRTYTITAQLKPLH